MPDTDNVTANSCDGEVNAGPSETIAISCRAKKFRATLN